MDLRAQASVFMPLGNVPGDHFNEHVQWVHQDELIVGWAEGEKGALGKRMNAFGKYGDLKTGRWHSSS